MDQADNTEARSGYLHLIDRLMLCLALVILLLAISARLSKLRSYSLNLSGEEQNVMYGLIKMDLGMPLYTDPEDVPFDVIQYTPGLYYLVTGVGAITGLDGEDPRSVYVVARSVGLVLNLLFVAAAFALARWLGARVGASALWASVLFSLLVMQVYSRPDALHLTLFAASMLLFFGSLRKKGREEAWQMGLATVVACGAVLAKQSGALTLFIIGGYLLFTRQWSLFLRQVLIGSAVLGLAFGVLAWHYDGQVLFKNIVTGIQNGPYASMIWLDMNFHHPARMLVQAVCLVLAVLMLRNPDAVRKAIGTGLLLSFFFAIFTTMKHGSSPGYHSENLFLVAAVMPTLQVSANGWRPIIVQLALFVLALANVRFSQLLRGAASMDDLLHAQIESAEYANARAMATEFRTDPSFQEGLVYLAAHDHLENFLVGRSVANAKDIYCLKSTREHLDLTGLQQAMDSGRIRFIVSTGTVPPLPFFGKNHPPFRYLGPRHGYHLYLNTAAINAQ